MANDEFGMKVQEPILQGTAPRQYTPPTVRFTSLTFSDGTVVDIGPSDVVVLVGPNNAGKSLALRELQDSIGRGHPSMVVAEAKAQHTGTAEDFSEYIYRHAKVTNVGGSVNVEVAGSSIGTSRVEDLWPGSLRHFVSLFCIRMSTDNRIKDSNPAPTFAPLDDIPSNPIHLLFVDEELEQRISQYFQRAFGAELAVFRLGGSRIPLLVGKDLAPAGGEGRLSVPYNQRLRDSTVPLEQQGDGMRSFASVILHLLAPTTPSILLLDEPEAFLHPPQAKLLGEVIAEEKPAGSQLFVATHSPDVLQGLVNVAPEHLRVLRIQRDGHVNQVRELNKDLVKRLSVDPLMKHSGVLSGVFHRRVIVCESDGDCMFYGALLDLPSVHGSQHPDVLFVHGNGNDRLAALAKTLTALDVKVDVIADMDILNDLVLFKGIVEALGDSWEPVAHLAKAVQREVEQGRPFVPGIEIKIGIEEALSKVPSQGSFPDEVESEIRSHFRRSSPWKYIKDSGVSALPAGLATVQFQQLQSLCNEMGLWLVPVGEMEGFCKSVASHGPRWVRQVLQRSNLADDHELEQARQFMRNIWDRLGS